jgi:hypothetical protein
MASGASTVGPLLQAANFPSIKKAHILRKIRNTIRDYAATGFQSKAADPKRLGVRIGFTSVSIPEPPKPLE